jgi:hypothetical protein
MESEPKKRWDWGKLIIPGVILCFFVTPYFCCSGVLDWMFGPERPKPMRAKPVTEELKRDLGEDAGKVSGFGMFDLGGAFLAHEYLWRFEASPEVMAQLTVKWKLTPAAVPAVFWEMGPTDWIRAMPDGGEAFQSPGFKPLGWKPEGEHYFVLYDKEKGVAYVWFKDN